MSIGFYEETSEVKAELFDEDSSCYLGLFNFSIIDVIELNADSVSDSSILTDGVFYFCNTFGLRRSGFFGGSLCSELKAEGVFICFSFGFCSGCFSSSF